MTIDTLASHVVASAWKYERHHHLKPSSAAVSGLIYFSAKLKENFSSFEKD